MPVLSNIKLRLLGAVMLNFCIRVVCLLTASLMATHTLSQDMSGWSDKTVCRLLVSKPDNSEYQAELEKRGIDCDKGRVRLSDDAGIQPSWRIFNDFSTKIYTQGISIQPSGYHPKAAEIDEGVAKFTLTPKMRSNYSPHFQRFEIGKKEIHPSYATRAIFKFRSDNNKVTDRTMIAQIKSAQKSAGGGSPIAAVYIDRPPQCATWSRVRYYPKKYTMWVAKPDRFTTDISENLYVYTQKIPNGMWEYNWMTKPSTHNMSYELLNDGAWHDIEMHAYPHRTEGFCRIFIDGELVLNIENASTKSYDNAQHGDYAVRIGIYRDSVDYNQTVEFDDLEIIGYRPLAGNANYDPSKLSLHLAPEKVHVSSAEICTPFGCKQESIVDAAATK
jgi:hypothetical protein